MDLYVSTSAWLDPIDLPNLRDETVPAPVLLDHLVVFDLDHGPFCRSRLEKVRRRTSALIRWLHQHTELELVHVTFSGGKGFHVILKDPDRRPFQASDPRIREQAVRNHRKALLDRVLEAGHPVDRTVTADTRRIIRIPGSIHGGTGWACTILKDGLIHRPLRHWVSTLPRSEHARRMTRWPPRTPKVGRSPAVEPTTVERSSDLRLELSTHVTGTKDRTALIIPVPTGQDHETRSTDMIRRLPEDVAPIGRFQVDSRQFIIVPRAFPRPRVIRILDRMGMRRTSNLHRTNGHAWLSLIGTDAGNLDPIIAMCWERLEEEVRHPWSAPHLEFCRRIGLEPPDISGDIAGRPEPRLRVVSRQ